MSLFKPETKLRAAFGFFTIPGKTLDDFSRFVPSDPKIFSEIPK